MTRITIEVHGYRWQVHGNKTGLMWHTHLVELLGAERLPPSVGCRDSFLVQGIGLGEGNTQLGGFRLDTVSASKKKNG